MLKIASCDELGSTYIDDKNVYRIVVPSQKQRVLETSKLIQELTSGNIIDTEVVSSSECPSQINADKSSLVLKHRKIKFISYPHEWCAAMLKDAALYHLELSISLLNKGLYLKDAHPWNILFEKGLYYFVDFTSIVTREALFNEDYLEANHNCADTDDSFRLAQLTKEIFQRMYIPYFFIPLCGYTFGTRSHMPHKIETTTLNVYPATISFRDCLPSLSLSLPTVRRLFGIFYKRYSIKKLISKLNKYGDILNFYKGLYDCVQKFDVSIKHSAYSNYYEIKDENQSHVFTTEWNDKQKSVYHALESDKIQTVLDIACNTGWYSIMAEKMGKVVVSFDCDEACIETLYNRVRQDELNILPLVMNILNFTPDRYSTFDGNKVLINTYDRFRCDSVLALGIVHHLILGAGLNFKIILQRINALCRKQFIMEFMRLTDEKIQGELSFFPAYFKNPNSFSDYTLEKITDSLRTFFPNIRTEKSYPDTRLILVCEK